MIRRWLAILLLVLAASPLTAPFQTWHVTGAGDTGAGIAAPVVSLTPSASTDAGSLVGPPRKGAWITSANDLQPVVCGQQPLETSSDAVCVVQSSDSISPPQRYSPLLTVLRL
ncbi:MAG: hypothetical protein AB7P22_01655 [Vicinamibacterales bacterium]